MAVTITGGKYAIRALTAVGTTNVTIGTGTFVSGDFGVTQRMVALYTSANVFKGIAWVRRFTSTTVLELENRFVDPVTGVYATQVVGDQILVSKNSAESAVTGFAVASPDNNVVTVTDNVLMGTAGSEVSLCFYDENKQFTITNGFQFDGGVSVFGKLLSYDGLTKESFIWSRECTVRPNDAYPAGGGSPAYNIWGTGGTSAHMFFFGGALGSPMRRSFFIGAQGSGATNKTYACYGTRIYYAAASPSGAAWASNPSRHLLYKTIHEADYNNANLIQWGDGAFQGSFLSFPQYGAGTPLGVFRASGTVSFGASANNRTVVADLGTGAFIDDINNGTYTFTNTITPAVSIVRHPGGATPITMQFSDDYTNLKTNTTVVLRRTVDSVVASSVVNTANSTFTATAVQSTYSATANGTATPTTSYSSFDYTVKCYAYQAISGNHATYSYSLGTAGSGTDLKLGGLVNQVADSTTTLSLAGALALSSKIAGNSGSDTCTISGSSTLDEQYDYLVAWGCSSAALAQYPSLSLYPVGSSGTTSIQRMKLFVTSGATLSAGTKLTDISGSKLVNVTGTGSTATFNRANITWSPATYSDQWFAQDGGTITLTNNSLFTNNAQTVLGYSGITMFGANTTLNLTDSVMVFNAPSGATNYNGSVFSAYQSAGTAKMNITNGTFTINGPTAGSLYVIHTYWSSASALNGWTINGTAASAVALEMGVTNQKLTGLSHAGTFAGAVDVTTNKLFYVHNDTFTYTGSSSLIDTTFGRMTKWVWLDPVRSDNALFRWAVGTSGATGANGAFGVVYFRPNIVIDKSGYAPKMRLTPSALASRYASKIVQTTALSTVALSNFYTDSGFASGDGALPFVDGLDDKTVINTIDWTVNFRQAGWLDQTTTFTASSAKYNTVNYSASGSADTNYVNATTAVADSALITVNTTTKTIAPVSGSLAWSPQRLYNALKQWWATYASDTDFLSATGNGVLNLGDYNTSSTISFIASASTDALQSVTTTGLINATVNQISVTDSRGTSTIWIFEEIEVGTSLAIYDGAGTTKYFQAQVSTAGTYSYYIAGGATGTYNVAVEKYPFKRETATFAANTGGILYFTPSYAEDVGITQTTQATVEAYTELETPSKVYDRTAVFRLTEQGIKIGQIFTRAGTNLEVQSGFSHVINKDASVVYGITGGVITTKSTAYAGDSKYTTEILVAPATLTANTTEIITIPYEDGGGNSSITIVGGRGTYEIWKIPSTTASADYETGTKIGDFTTANNLYRFIGDTSAGYDYLTVDLTTTVKDRYPATKGVYVHALYSGAEIQLAQAPEVIENGVKLSIIQQDLADIKGTGFATAKQSLVSLRKHVTAQNQA